MRSRTVRLLRIAAPVALAAAIGVAGVSAAASPTPQTRGGTGLVLPTDTTVPSDPAPSASPTDPAPSPSDCAAQCAECDLAAPSPTSTATTDPPVLGAGRRTGAKPARSAAAAAVPAEVTLTFSFAIGATGDPGVPTITTDPKGQSAWFTAVSLRNRGNCYILLFNSQFLKCGDPIITLDPNIDVRTRLRVDEVKNGINGDYWYHQYQFANAATPLAAIPKGTKITISFTCE